MTLVSGLSKLASVDVRGEFGFSCGFGKGKWNLGRWGFYSPYAGIFSGKVTKKGRGLSQMIFYRPSNPQTPIQQAWRAKFTAGKAAWDALTPDEKLALSKEAQGRGMTGYNLFQSRWLRTP